MKTENGLVLGPGPDASEEAGLEYGDFNNVPGVLEDPEVCKELSAKLTDGLRAEEQLDVEAALEVAENIRRLI